MATASKTDDEYPWFLAEAVRVRRGRVLRTALRLPRFADAHTGPVLARMVELRKAQQSEEPTTDFEFIAGVFDAMAEDEVLTAAEVETIKQMGLVRISELYAAWSEAEGATVGESPASDG